MSKKTKFKPCRPRIWKGRYCRIPGKTTVFHAKADGSMEVYWENKADSIRYTAVAVDSPAIAELIDAVNDYKVEVTGIRGGGFLINEFGQVLVPDSDSRERRIGLVGEFEGPLEFVDGEEEVFNLMAEEYSDPGESWDLPYVGMFFNLMADNRIRYKHTIQDAKKPVFLPCDSDALVEALREVRPSGLLRFIVNLHGVVLTRIEPDWSPVFVCRLDYDQWFEKE